VDVYEREERLSERDGVEEMVGGGSSGRCAACGVGLPLGDVAEGEEDGDEEQG